MNNCYLIHEHIRLRGIDGNAFFCPNRKIRSVVLTIRGTFSLADAISDIVCDEDPFLVKML
jgi:hypothetical protein